VAKTCSENDQDDMFTSLQQLLSSWGHSRCHPESGFSNLVLASDNRKGEAGSEQLGVQCMKTIENVVDIVRGSRCSVGGDRTAVANNW
jgi:hypothetical protein